MKMMNRFIAPLNSCNYAGGVNQKSNRVLGLVALHNPGCVFLLLSWSVVLRIGHRTRDVE